VYVVHRGIAKKTEIKTGLSNDSQTVVKSGLTRGDTIVTEKIATLTDGARVTPAPSSSPSAAP
jgi:hypothetical protein